MSILIRYVLSDLLKVFFLVLTALTVLVFVVLLGNEAVDKGLGLGPLLRMTPYLLPQALQFAVPAAMLLATANVYGRMSSLNEIVAIKSLGISPMAVIWPTLVLSVLVSFVAVVLNDVAVSWGRAGVERVFLNSIEEVAYGQLRMRRTYNIGPANITVRDVQGHTLIRPTLIVSSSGDRPALTVTAAEAEMSSFPEEGKIVMRFRNFEVDGPVTFTDPDVFEYTASLEEFTGTSSGSRSPSFYALREIGPAVDEQNELVSQIRQGMTADAAFSLMTGNFDALSDSAWSAHQRALEGAEYRLHRLYTEPWRRWANGFSCLCFVLIGAPMAIRLRHAEFLASFFACFLPILVVYYPLLAVSVDHAKDGSLPPQIVWLGNIVLALWGLWLLRRVIRY
jgi:lipopolysaccharide export system permease protein